MDNQQEPYKVTAVIKDIPHNSHLNVEFFFSHEKCGLSMGKLPAIISIPTCVATGNRL